MTKTKKTLNNTQPESDLLKNQKLDALKAALASIDLLVKRFNENNECILDDDEKEIISMLSKDGLVRIKDKRIAETINNMKEIDTVSDVESDEKVSIAVFASIDLLVKRFNENNECILNDDEKEIISMLSKQGIVRIKDKRIAEKINNMKEIDKVSDAESDEKDSSANSYNPIKNGNGKRERTNLNCNLPVRVLLQPSK
jgi:predicted transcriptional regulator YheO